MRFIADESHVNVIGRTLFYDEIRYLNYSCAAVEFTFTGSKAEAVLWTDSPLLDPIYKAWIAVFVNDEKEPSRRFALEETEATYLLYEGSEVKPTKIRLVKYSEAAFGKVGIKAIIIDSDVPPVPTQKKARKLEFIGDSITCGYGNEGMFGIDMFSTSQENPWEAYAALSSRALEADYQLISWSGIGIISCYTEQDVPNNDWLMPGLYPYSDKATDLALNSKELEPWDYSRFVPDCIIINLGTNDSSYTKHIPDRVESFGKEYYKFIQYVRACNPDSKILCTLGAMGQDLCEEIERQVKLLTSEGDRKIYYMAFDVQKEQDGIATDWHPNIITHRKMADKLEGKVREIMGW
jgi:lysophospholipase L1-like esterase